MKRWHVERPLMLRRWQLEKEKHTDNGEIVGDCHCLRGPGFMRKRRPYGCHRPRCKLCHWEKLYPQPRGPKKRAEIEFERIASGEF
jgi:hypothetical protein